MKKLFLIAIIVLATACGTKTTESDDYAIDTLYERPSDIPETLWNGKKVYWDRSWQESYLNGDIHILYNKDGSVKLVGRYLNNP